MTSQNDIHTQYAQIHTYITEHKMEPIHLSYEEFEQNTYGFHATPAKNIPEILADGLKLPSDSTHSMIFDMDYVMEGESADKKPSDAVYFFDALGGALNQFDMMSLYQKEKHDINILPSVIIFQTPAAENIDFDPEMHPELHEKYIRAERQTFLERRLARTSPLLRWGETDSDGNYSSFFTIKPIPTEKLRYVCIPEEQLMERMRTAQKQMKKIHLPPIENFEEQIAFFAKHRNTDDPAIKEILDTLNFGMRVQCFTTPLTHSSD